MTEIKLLKGDCLELMKRLPDNSIDMVLTDPPYNISRDNNFHTMGRKGIDFGEWDKNFEQLSWLKVASEKLKAGGSIVVFNSWKNLGLISDFTDSLGLVRKDSMRWIKDNPMPRNRDRRYIVDFEYCLWITKKGKWTFNRLNEKYDRPEFRYPIVSGKEKTGHPTQKPVALMQELVLRHSNPKDIILDPFMGSGSTGVACVNTDRNFIGMELNEEYFNIAEKRINESTALNGGNLVRYRRNQTRKGKLTD